MSLNDPSAALDAMADSLAAYLPERIVSRDLVDPANTKAQDLQAGVLCVVAKGGGGFANYLGREADLGHVDVSVVGFVQVAEKAPAADVERAELALLLDVRQWIHNPAAHGGTVGYGAGIDSVYPEDFQLSKQLDHPYGWFVFSLRVKC